MKWKILNDLNFYNCCLNNKFCACVNTVINTPTILQKTIALRQNVETSLNWKTHSDAYFFKKRMSLFMSATPKDGMQCSLTHTHAYTLAPTPIHRYTHNYTHTYKYTLTHSLNTHTHTLTHCNKSLSHNGQCTMSIAYWPLYAGIYE